jgi:hypothetical protein
VWLCVMVSSELFAVLLLNGMEHGWVERGC